MKTWTSILAAGAILAFAAPAGNAALGGLPSDPGTSAGASVALHRTVPTVGSVRLSKQQAAKIKALAAKNKALRAQNKVLAAQIDWLITHPPVIDPRPPVVPAPADDCITNMVGCTDLELCQIWGANCDLVPPVVTDAPAAVTPAPEPPAADSAASSTTNGPAQLVAADPNVYLDSSYSDDC